MIRLLAGDCRDVLATLPAESVQCVVTSPPYYGLRDYGTALWDGGDAGCDHVVARVTERSRVQHDIYAPPSGWTNRDATPPRQCACGAVRVDRQIGLEATPDLYLQTMVGVFRELRRVLRRDGTCWVNIGDSFSGGNSTGWRPGNPEKNGGASNRDGVGNVPGLAAKQLLLMPARLALALQQDGWWVRSDIIWHKPNPMPESCTDRPTSAHEHVFLLTKSARYWYDADAVREERLGDVDGASFRGDCYVGGVPGKRNVIGNQAAIANGRSCRNVWTIATHPYSAAHFATFPPELAERCIKAGTSERGCCAACGKPWGRVTERSFNVPTRIATKRVPVDNAAVGAYLRQCREASGLLQKDVAAHFPSATGGLTGCVANWELGLNTPMPEQWPKLKESLGLDDRFDAQIYGTAEVEVADAPQAQPRAFGVRTYAKAWNTATETTGWSAGCQCNAATVPCTVLDPFIGAGTTALVADRLQRDVIGIDLNTQYTRMAMDRCIADAPLFTSFPPAEPPEDERMADLFTDMAAD